jgi:glycine/D-amino acid oxidase-like deaminating enzyme
MKKVDFFIVGQGISGTVLSHQLMDQGYTVHVFDRFKENSASRIAAGVYNPVAYRKLKMAEFADFLIPEMKAYYEQLEAELNGHFFKPMSFLKMLTDFEEFNNWQAQCCLENNQPFMSPVVFKEDFNQGIKNPFGAGQVLQSGVVNIPELLDLWKTQLTERDALETQAFGYEKLQVQSDGLVYGDVEAEKIIFCEGVGVLNNPWFSWLPIQQFKGETLEIEAPTLDLNRMVNRGVFLLPMENGNYKVGATHDWRNVDEIPTEEGKMELVEKLDKFINVPYTIVNHWAGLRPAARDRHPYIGVHPEMERMYVFNGLGSKGVIMAPWLAKHFIIGLEKHEWPKQFNIKRYIRFFNEKNQSNEKN